MDSLKMDMEKTMDLLQKYPYPVLVRIVESLETRVERLENRVFILVMMVALLTFLFHTLAKDDDRFAWPWKKSKRNSRKKMEADCEANQSTNQRTKSTTTNNFVQIDISKVE